MESRTKMANRSNVDSSSRRDSERVEMGNATPLIAIEMSEKQTQKRGRAYSRINGGTKLKSEMKSARIGAQTSPQPRGSTARL